MLLRSYQPIEDLFPAEDRHADRLSRLRQAQSLIKDLLRARIHFLRDQTSAGTRHVEYVLQKYDLNRTDLQRLRPFLRVLEDWENLP